MATDKGVGGRGLIAGTKSSLAMRWMLGAIALGLASACTPPPVGPGPPQPPEPTATAATSATPPKVDGPILKLSEPVQGGMSVEGVTALCDDNLALAEAVLASIKGLDPSDLSALTWERTFGRLDEAVLSINNASEFPYLMGVAHPEEAVRNAARACETKTDKLVTGIFLDASLAGVLQAYAAKKESLTPERQRFVEHTLRDFRRNGIDLVADKQLRLREINKEITQLGQRFIAEISASKGSIEVTAAQLAGLPDGYKKAHTPDAKGKVTITTDYPDYYPFVKYALDRESAKRLYVKFVNRGGDVNVSRLDRLFSLRHEKAAMLGYTSWADYAIEPRMATDANDVQAFLDRVGKAIAPAVKDELAQFRSEFGKLTRNPKKRMAPSDRYFLTERLKNKRYAFDSKELAKYFEIKSVTGGLFDITAKMYGLEYRTVKEAAWHPDVTVHELWSGKQRIGKFYLDLHPRDHKYKHAAMFTVRTPKVLADGSEQTPIAALMCNFPRPGEPMPHDQVVTYFHEFGHVLHHLLTKTEIASVSGTNTVRDFVETPSQMFEEWAWSREVLDRFAKHPDSGNKIPGALYDALTNSRRFGLALATERQLFLARLDLGFHVRKPGFDTTKVLQEIHQEHFSFVYVAGTHFQSSFGHLIGYDAGYYGYQWALALAHDVLSRFKKEGLLNPNTARDWRDKVLSRGGSLDERGLITAFLGRPPSEQAYADFLKGE
jgi:Zn-dependent oligopeptidase